MARQKFNITLPDGRSVWLTGATVSEAFLNGLEKYGNIRKKEILEGRAPLLRIYAEQWFRVFYLPKVKTNTANNTRIILKKHIYPYIGSKRLNEVSVADIQQIFNEKMSLSRSTTQKIKIILHQIFQSAMEDGYIEKNPAASTRLTISEKVTVRNALTLNEVEDIVKHLPSLDMEDRKLILLPLYTGMRRGEILGLKWTDIDIEKKWIHVERAVTFTGNHPVIGKPKSKAGYRVIPILPELETFLRALPQEGEYVIGGAAPISETTYKRTWERIERKIDLHHATAHVFRHTFATVAAPYLDIKTLQSIMGHADIETTLDRYTHPQENRILGAAQILAGKFQTSGDS